MTQVIRHFYQPIYEALCHTTACGQILRYFVKNKYPDEIDRITCPKCHRASNVQFKLENGVMLMELREIKVS